MVQLPKCYPEGVLGGGFVTGLRNESLLHFAILTMGCYLILRRNVNLITDFVRIWLLTPPMEMVQLHFAIVLARDRRPWVTYVN